MDPRVDEQEEYKYARQLVIAYFQMMTVGCGTSGCINSYCRSNASNSLLPPNEAFVKSVELATRHPVPLCVLLPSANCKIFNESEERPEVDEDEDEATLVTPELACSARRRLSHAMEMDHTLNLSGPNREDTSNMLVQSNGIPDGRRVSLSKQKLMDALQKSSPMNRPELHVAKKH